MGLRIATNIASQEVQKNLNRVSGSAQESLSKLSSGERITKAADDAAGLAIAKRLEATSRGLKQAKRNANDGISYVQTAEGGLNEVSNMLTRMRELSVQAASDTVGDNERGLLDKEYQQLIQEIDRISESSEFNGAKLLNGEGNGTLTFHVGAEAGEANKIEFDSAETNSTAGNIGVDGLSVSDKDGAESAIGDIDGAIDQISGFRANLGAIQSRLESTVSNLDSQVINQDSAKSVILDVDVAEEASKLASSNVIKQAGISSLAQANNIPNSALKLI